MGNILELKYFCDDRGTLTVIEKELPFSVKRIFYISNVPKNTKRGGHRHVKNRQALISIQGECTVDWNNGIKEDSCVLDNPQKCLILEPEDFHFMHSFSENAILLVMASEYFEKNDYIYEGYAT